MKTGHVLGWLSSLAIKGEPPLTTASGEEYATPHTGILCSPLPWLREFPYIEGKDSWILSQLAMMGSGVGQLSLSRKANNEAAEIARQEGLIAYATVLELELSPVNSYLGDYFEALTSLMAGIVGIPLIKTGGLMTKDDPNETWGSLSIPEKTTIEDMHVYPFVILPAIAGLLKRSDKQLCLRKINSMQQSIQLLRESIFTYRRY